MFFPFLLSAFVAGVRAALPLIARQPADGAGTSNANGTAAANATAPHAGIQRLSLSSGKTCVADHRART